VLELSVATRRKERDDLPRYEDQPHWVRAVVHHEHCAETEILDLKRSAFAVSPHACRVMRKTKEP